MASTEANKPAEKVLLVDDEPALLESLERGLRRSFNIQSAVGPDAGLEAVVREGDFAVVLSDLRMPGMDGITFLGRVREHAPESVRILLTGHADLNSAMAAVNDGALFRFLTKPCTPGDLQQALTAAVHQHRLITAERTLLERTLHGSIKALMDVLALINPAGFGRATRAKRLVSEFMTHLEMESSWELDIAAMLSQIGSVTLSSETVEKLYRGENLTYAESIAAEKLPRVASELIADIPRLGLVREVLSAQNLRFDGRGSPPRSPRGTEIPWGARALKIVHDFDLLVTKKLAVGEALDTMRDRQGFYDPEMLQAFAEMHEAATPQNRIEKLSLKSIRPGMIFAEDVQTRTGLLLVARGQEASERLVERIRNLSHLDLVQESVHVVIPAVGSPEGTTLAVA